MRTPEIGLEDIPAPGEPLIPKIHEINQKLLDEEMAERARRAQSKLTRRQIRHMNRRYQSLRSMLIKARWNDLVSAHWQAAQACTRLAHEIKGTTGSKWRALMMQRMAAITERKRVAALMASIQPIADEFESIKRRFKSHEEVIAWERQDTEDKAQFRRESRTWQAQLEAGFRQTPRLHHAGEDSKGRRFIKIPKIDNVIFKDDRVYYHIATSTQGLLGRLLGRWFPLLPYGVDVPDLASDVTLENLSAVCGRVVTVFRAGTNFFYCISRLDSPDGLPKRVLYSKLIEWYPRHDHVKTPWIMGASEDRKVKFADFETHPHILLAGSTQGGKSNHLNQMIATFATMNSPSELGLLLIDLKGGIEFVHWEGLKHQIRPMVKTQGEVLEALQFMHAIMDRRLVMFKSVMAKNLESFNDKVKDKLPRLIVIVDEMATLIGLGDLTTAIHTELRVLSAQGRAVGIHLVLCTQHSSVEMIPGWVKTNMGIRGSAPMPSDVASRIILDTGTAATLPKIPGRLVFSLGREEVIVQSPYISDSEIARAVEISRSFPDPDRTEFDLSTKAPITPPKEKFSRNELYEIVLTKLEGKISASNIFEEIGGKENDVITLRQLRSMVSGVIEIGLEKGIDYGGHHYRLRKVQGRGNYSMELSKPQSEPRSDLDTQEMKALASLERSQPELEAV